jgi:hypothetical protein
MGREERGRLDALQSGGCHILLLFTLLSDGKELHLNSSTVPSSLLFFPFLSFFSFPFSSDEPAEVAVVKTAPIQHLKLDSKMTLSVLCDRIVLPDEPMGGEDKVTCARWSWRSSQKTRGGPS